MHRDRRTEIPVAVRLRRMSENVPTRDETWAAVECKAGYGSPVDIKQHSVNRIRAQPARARRKVTMPGIPTAPLLAGAALVLLPLVAAVAAVPVDDATARVRAAADAVEPVSAAMTMRGPGGRDDDVAESTDAAVRALGAHVTRASHPDALRTAFRAYFRYRAVRGDEIRKPYFYYVDLGLGNATPRGYVFDMERLALVEGPFTVAHGRGSSKERNGVPSTFSNRPGSNASSLGLYLAQETYNFSGKSAGRPYTSVGLRMRGESGEFNGAARARGIVAHGAPYVTAREAGRSEGCPAMEQQRARRLLPMIADGGVVFIYSPNDDRWLRSDPWINAD
jgi:hypothetical protein